ncbi:MAG: M28 family peptidase, partial [Planctomycetes bacterium]|nr:M28 family peptidase [Planctomycetota bacterium]
MARAWSRLLAEARGARARGEFRIPAYSEFLPPPYVGVKPSGELDPFSRTEGNESGFNISEYEEICELRPGLERIARSLAADFRDLLAGRPNGLSKAILAGNPAWPRGLEERAPSLSRDAFAMIVPLALSRTQDDKGRVRWTLFGSSHEGPSRAFWRSFHDEDHASLDTNALDEFRRLVAWDSGERPEAFRDLRGAGVRVLPCGRDPGLPTWFDEGLPEFAGKLLLDDRERIGRVRVLVTFRPFAKLPGPVQEAFLAGELRLFPAPWSLLFWGHPGYRRLAGELPWALQIPLARRFPGSGLLDGLRIPQSGWLDEIPDAAQRPEVRRRAATRIRRSHRFQKVERDAEDLADPLLDDPVTVALFSTDEGAIGLYGKPMARNCQVWTEDYRRILDGPRASREELAVAKRAFAAGGRYRYRLFYPPMQVGERSVFWHRPLVARSLPDGTVRVLPDAALGHLTAERAGSRPIELWPRLERRPGHKEAARVLVRFPVRRARTNATAVRKLFEWRELLGKPLPASFARALAGIPRDTSLERWIAGLDGDPSPHSRLPRFEKLVRSRIGPDLPPAGDHCLTFEFTRTREFEERYWKAMVELSAGRFRDKNNADVIGANRGRTGGNPARENGRSAARARHLDSLREHLHRLHERAIEKAGMNSRALVADHVFRWETEFDYDWWGGWLANRTGASAEKNVVVVIPGRNRREAIVMADHYDTAYMEDLYETARGGDRLRAAAPGADDNHSATAALLLAAEALLPLAREGRLARDVWLVHLTGEEFPADCLGARALAASLVSRKLVLTAPEGSSIDLSGTRAAGVFDLDMIAHNGGRARDVFQIAPGEGKGSARLALAAHLATESWNRHARTWNARPDRRGLGRASRVAF